MKNICLLYLLFSISIIVITSGVLNNHPSKKHFHVDNSNEKSQETNIDCENTLHSSSYLNDLSNSDQSFDTKDFIKNLKNVGAELSQPFERGLLDIFQPLLSTIEDLNFSTKNEEEEIVQQKTTVDIIEQYDYPYEIHQIYTEDDYMLEMHRIPTDIQDAKFRGVVFLMHGLLSSSADWVVIGPKSALAFLLHDLNFDVWLGNARGNKYSRGHKYLNHETDSKYWDFSWHEIGTKDLPAMIDYILQTTGQKQLTYVGHSQGTTAYFVMTSELPEYNYKVKSMQALGPVVLLNNASNIFMTLMMPLLFGSMFLTNLLGQFEFMPSNGLLTLLGRLLCPEEIAQDVACTNIYFLFAGYNPENLNKTTIAEIVNNIPAGASIKQLMHYGQIIEFKKFQKYNYGPSENLKFYETTQPPEYNLKNVTSPVALYVGLNDDLADPEDVKKLTKILPNVVLNYVVPEENWLHVDFLWALNVEKLLYSKVIEQILLFSN